MDRLCFWSFFTKSPLLKKKKINCGLGSWVLDVVQLIPLADKCCTSLRTVEGLCDSRMGFRKCVCVWGWETEGERLGLFSS